MKCVHYQSDLHGHSFVRFSACGQVFQATGLYWTCGGAVQFRHDGICCPGSCQPVTQRGAARNTTAAHTGTNNGAEHIRQTSGAS